MRKNVPRSGKAVELSLSLRRAVVVREAMADIRVIESTGVDRVAVDGIRNRLIALAADKELFPRSDFPVPQSNIGGQLYLLSQDSDGRFALYVQVVAGANSTPAHDHTTWAVIVGLEGQELNRVYDGHAEKGKPEVVSEYVVEHGTGIAFLPEDVHSIHIEDGSLNFHCYGLDLNALSERQYWSEDSNEWKYFKNKFDIIDART
ncbi:MAG: putative metal-dependent enzyme (double-stranded beta helix superfamily) [Candidatus Poriferisodalaceae bacterium]